MKKKEKKKKQEKIYILNFHFQFFCPKIIRQMSRGS